MSWGAPKWYEAPLFIIMLIGVCIRAPFVYAWRKITGGVNK